MDPVCSRVLPAMSLLGKIFGNPTGGILDDQAERTFARRVGLAAILLGGGMGIFFILAGISCL